MKRQIAAALVAASTAVWIGMAHPAEAQAPRTYQARLSQVPVDAANLANVTGNGSVTATLSGTTLTLTGTYEGLRTPATIAQIHRAAKGIRGPAVFDLKVSGGTSGTINGSIQLTPAQVEDLGRERYYVQLHSEKAPDGNLWGWLLLPRENKR